MILLKKKTTELLMRLCGCAGWSAPLLLQITKTGFPSRGPIAICVIYHERLENKMRNLIIVKYDNLEL